jgi:DNA replication protein DnaC
MSDLTKKIDIIEMIKILRLPMVAEKLKQLLDNPDQSIKEFAVFLAKLIDDQVNSRLTNRLNRLIRSSNLEDLDACLDGIKFTKGRNLDKKAICGLFEGDYMANAFNVIFVGATGTGKSYLANGLGMAAIQNFKRVRYYRYNRLISALAEARQAGDIESLKVTLAKVDLLIIDEWLLDDLKFEDTLDLLEVLDSRYLKRSTIFSSIHGVESWVARLGSTGAAESIVDRIIHNSHFFLLETKISMRAEKAQEIGHHS